MTFSVKPSMLNTCARAFGLAVVLPLVMAQNASAQDAAPRSFPYPFFDLALSAPEDISAANTTFQKKTADGAPQTLEWTAPDGTVLAVYGDFIATFRVASLGETDLGAFLTVGMKLDIRYKAPKPNAGHALLQLLDEDKQILQALRLERPPWNCLIGTQDYLTSKTLEASRAAFDAAKYLRVVTTLDAPTRASKMTKC